MLQTTRGYSICDTNVLVSFYATSKNVKLEIIFHDAYEVEALDARSFLSSLLARATALFFISLISLINLEIRIGATLLHNTN